MIYRYNNIEKKCMKKVNRKILEDGRIVIFVEECDSFSGRKFKYYLDKSEVL